MEVLLAGCLVFLVTHLVISGTRLRSLLQRHLRANSYLITYSLVSFASLCVMIFGYGQVSEAEVIWRGTPELIKLSKVLVLASFILIVIGVMTPNPTALGFESEIGKEIVGMLKITRHPVQWGVLLFATAHIISNGDVASLILFGTLAAVSFLGMFSIDARRREDTDLRWQSFMFQTSMVPFLAILRGRQKLEVTDFNRIGTAVAILLYSLIYVVHHWISGGISLL